MTAKIDLLYKNYKTQRYYKCVCCYISNSDVKQTFKTQYTKGQLHKRGLTNPGVKPRIKPMRTPNRRRCHFQKLSYFTSLTFRFDLK